MNTKEKKSRISYSLLPEYGEEIRAYVDKQKKETGASKGYIITHLLLNAIRNE